MFLTVLNLVKRAAYECNIPTPTALISSTSTLDLQLRYLLVAQARALRNHRIFPQQKKEYNFSIEEGRTNYYLPRDYYAALPQTQWDTDRKWRLIGPLSDAAFTDRVRGEISSTNQIAYRIFGPDFNDNGVGGQFIVDPAFPDDAALFFEYITATTFLPKHWQPSTAYTSGVYVNANGNIYLCDTNGTSGATAPSDQTNNITDGTTRWDWIEDTYDEPVADTDLCLFDDDVMIAGLKWRFLEARKQDYQQAKADYDDLVERTVSRLKGSFVGRMDCPRSDRRSGYYVPNGGWSF